MRILNRRKCLIPLELARIQHTGFILQGALQGDGPLAVVEEDGFMRRIREHKEENHGNNTGDCPEDNEERFPVIDIGLRDMADSVCNETTREVCNTIACSVSGYKSRGTRIPRNQAASLVMLVG